MWCLIRFYFFLINNTSSCIVSFAHYENFNERYVENWRAVTRELGGKRAVSWETLLKYTATYYCHCIFYSMHLLLYILWEPSVRLESKYNHLRIRASGVNTWGVIQWVARFKWKEWVENWAVSVSLPYIVSFTNNGRVHTRKFFVWSHWWKWTKLAQKLRDPTHGTEGVKWQGVHCIPTRRLVCIYRWPG